MTQRKAFCRLMGGLALGSLLTVASCGPGSDQEVQVPDSIMGVWVTEAPAMADRIFEITSEEVFFQTGPDSYTLHAIRGIEQVDRDGESDFDLEYRGLSGQPEQFRITASGSEIVMRNRPDVRWRRNADRARDWPWRLPAGAD